MIDDGHAVHYTAVSPGTVVLSTDGIEVGTVESILDNDREHIFDGIVMRHADGRTRFVDAPEVARTAERAVTLTISAAEAQELPTPQAAGAGARSDLGGGGALSRLLKGGWRRG